MKRGTQGWLTISLGLLLLSTPLPLLLLTGATAQAQAVSAETQAGYRLLAQGRVNDAIATFQRATRQTPGSVEAWLGLAIAYRRAGQDANAFAAYQQVLQLAPNNALALKSVGLLGGFRPEWQTQGIAALTTLLQLNPQDSEARAQRALLFRYQGRFPEALADYQLLLRATPTPAVVLGAATTLAYSGNYSEALTLFNRYQQQGGKITGEGAIAYARTLRNLGNPAAAVQILQAQLTNQTDDLNTQTRVELAQAYVAIQQPAPALAVIEPLRTRPGATLALARGLHEIGQRLNHAALQSEAAQLYRQVLSQTPNPSPTLLREIADVWSGQPAERANALQLYRQLAQLQPDDRGLQLKRLALERQLGFLSRAQIRAAVPPLVQPLPPDPQQRQAIAQGLIRLDPEPEWLPLYQALLQDPAVNAPFLNFRVAQVLLQRSDLVGARNALAAYTASPASAGDLAPQLLAADIERREGNLAAAAQRYEAILAANPTTDDLFMGTVQGLAAVRVAQGRTPEALMLLDQLMLRYPQDLRVPLARATIAYSAKLISTAQAEAVLNAWLSQRPPTDTPPELFNLVAALPANPTYEPLYQLLAAADPQQIPVQVRLIQVLAQRDRTAAQAQMVQLVARSQALGMTPVDLYLLQGELAFAIQDFSLARASFESALQLQPLQADALIGLGNVAYQQRRFTQAERYYNQALVLKPGDMEIQRSRVEVKVAQDYPLQAITQLETLQQQAGGASPELALRRQQIEENLLKRRGFQPPWERY